MGKKTPEQLRRTLELRRSSAAQPPRNRAKYTRTRKHRTTWR